MFVGGILRPSGIWCFLGGEREVSPRMSLLLRPQPARAPRTQWQLHAPLETPPDAAFPARGRRQGPEPHEGTTQIAIISSLAKTSNSPNYPAREKKTQNENKLTCLHRSCRSNRHSRARAHAGACPSRALSHRRCRPLPRPGTPWQG